MIPQRILVLWTGERPGFGPDGLEPGDILDVLDGQCAPSPNDLANVNVRFVASPVLGVEADAYVQSRFERLDHIHQRQIYYREYCVPMEFVATLRPGVIEWRSRADMEALIRRKP